MPVLLTVGLLRRCALGMRSVPPAIAGGSRLMPPLQSALHRLSATKRQAGMPVLLTPLPPPQHLNNLWRVRARNRLLVEKPET